MYLLDHFAEEKKLYERETEHALISCTSNTVTQVPELLLAADPPYRYPHLHSHHHRHRKHRSASQQQTPRIMIGGALLP